MATADITAGLIAYLKTLGGVTSLVGTGTAARIYPDDLKQSATLPAMTVTRLSGGPVTYLGGRSGINDATFQIVSYGATRAAADALDNAAFDTMGSLANATMGSVKTTDTQAQPGSRDSGVDLPLDGSDARRYWARTTYRIFYFDS